MPGCKPEPIMANRSSVLREREGEKQRKTLHHRLPDRGIATCNTTSIITTYGVYYSFIIHCKIRILAYCITADRLKILKQKLLSPECRGQEAICFLCEGVLHPAGLRFISHFLIDARAYVSACSKPR